MEKTNKAEKARSNRKMFINLAVLDLKRSMEFFSKLGFSFDPRFTDDKAACMIVSEEAYVMLLMEPFFKGFTKREVCDTSRQTEALLALSCESRAEVDEMVKKAVAGGGRQAMEPQDHGFMYGWSFYDLDGHHWEVLWMDGSAAEAGESKPKVTLDAKIVPHLWFVDQAVEAANFYVSLFPDSHVDSVTMIPADTPSGRSGTIPVVELTLAGQQFQAISAGPLDPFNHAISFIVNCTDQAEVDRLWEALSAGGTIEQCGWLRDRYGVSWQIVPAVLGEMMKDPDRNRARRVAEAMLGMKKIDIRGLQNALAG
jgi:predicted 3-demethylubiquinone-9 3-methyltransferase (glyoxalase superfamily)/predicted lactoylglutathione lyase